MANDNANEPTLVPRSLHVEQLLRADRLQQRLSIAEDELTQLRKQLHGLHERVAIAERQVKRALSERDAAIEAYNAKPFEPCACGHERRHHSEHVAHCLTCRDCFTYRTATARKAVG